MEPLPKSGDGGATDDLDIRRRRGRPRDEAAHRAILDATEDLVVEGGYQAMTVEQIAARAGVGKATVYRWWPSKAHLTLEMVTTRWFEVGELPDTGDIRRDLVEFMRVNFENHARGGLPLMNQIVADLEAGGHVAAIAEAQDFFVDQRRALGRAVMGRAVDQGVLPRDADIDLLLDVAAGVLLYQSLTSGSPGDLVDLDRIADLVLHGTVPRRATPTRAE
jgi:AcrR family transcriptional regulator